MGNTRSLRRKLNAEKVFIAEQVAQKRTEIVKKFVEERVKKDAEFASDVLKAVGDALPENIKKIAEETIKNSKTEAVVKKWGNTGLFDQEEINPSLMKPIVESQAKELLTDGTLAKLANDAIKGKLQVNPNTKTSQSRIYPLKNP
jgi:hypothetical protein